MSAKVGHYNRKIPVPTAFVLIVYNEVIELLGSVQRDHLMRLHHFISQLSSSLCI